MFDNTKYIVVGNMVSGNDKIRHLVNVRIFPFHPSVSHKVMFKGIQKLGFGILISAGFIDEFMQCYGSSTTLRVSSRTEEDTELLHEMFKIQDKKLKFK